MATATRLLWSNECTVSGVTITSSDEVTNYPDDNVANVGRWKIWRSTTTTGDQWIKFDLGANKTMLGIFLVNYLAHTTGGTIKVQADADDASWGAPTVDETLALPSHNPTGVIGAFFSTQSLRWVRIYFTNVGAVNEYVELGLAFAGSYIETQIKGGQTIEPVDPSLVVRALDGQEESHARTKYFRFSNLFNFKTESERDDFLEMYATIGTSKPFFFLVSPTDNYQQYYGRFESLNYSHIPTVSWDIPFSFVESR